MARKGPKPRDLTGKRFGKLVVLRSSHSDGKAIWEVCLCDCGKEHLVRRGNLESTPGTRSCGCSLLGNAKHLTHGRTRTPEWNAWTHMRQRCSNPNDKSYKNYGGRGITVCTKWNNDFSAFFADMGGKPSDQHSIDRINNDGHYEPSNCRWATVKQQANNRRLPSVYHGNRNSLANLRGKTSEEMKAIWNTKRAHERVIPKTCETCGTKFYRRGKPRGKHIYCSHKCYAQFRAD